MATNVLTPTQERFLDAFFREPQKAFYLSGGTALAAYHLQHRRSDDLDFFTRDSNGLDFAEPLIRRAADGAGLTIERVNRHTGGAQYFLSGDSELDHPLVKCDVMLDTEPYFAAPVSFGHVLVDDLLAIAVNKLTIVTRTDPKDYFDRYAIHLSGRIPFERLVELAKQKLVGLDELTLAAHFRAVDELMNLAEFQQKYLLIDIDLAQLVRFFHDWAARLIDVIGRGTPK